MDKPKRWEERIKEAVQRGKFTEEDYELAHDWVTCACGEQDPRIRRTALGTPVDQILYERGQKFAVAVEDNDFEAADFLLFRIEQRADRLLRDQAQAEEQAQAEAQVQEDADEQ